MDSTDLRALLPAAADEPACDGHAWLRRRRRRRRFALELDRRGVFLRLGQTEAYLCAEPEGRGGQRHRLSFGPHPDIEFGVDVDPHAIAGDERVLPRPSIFS